MAIKIKGVTVIDDDRKGYFDTISVGSQTTGGTTIEVESTSPAFKVIQKGTGNAFVVEDELNDTTPFIIDSAGNVQISGNLVVNGTTATVNATNIALNDPVLLLGGENAPTVNDGKDRGILYRWHDGSNAKLGFFGFDRSGGNLVFWADATNTNEVISGTQGTVEALTFKSTAATGTSPLAVASTTKVSNLNADLVDGINFSTPTQWGVTYASSSSNLSSTSAGSAGQLLRSSGSGAPSWTTATFPNTATTTGAILRADGSNWVATTATYPASAGAVGTILRATSTGFVNSTATYPDTISQNQLLYASSSNTISGLNSASNSILVTSASGAPSFSSTLPQVSITTAVTVPTVFGSTSASGSLQLTSTSNATKGTVYLGTAGDTVRLGNAATFGVVVTNDNFGRMAVTGGTAKQFLVANSNSSTPTFQTRSPTINFTGDVTGSVTLTDLDGTFNVAMTVDQVDDGTTRGQINVNQASAGPSTLLTFQWPEYTGGEIIVSVLQNGKQQIVKLLVVTDGTNVYLTEYAHTGSAGNATPIDYQLVFYQYQEYGVATVQAISAGSAASFRGTYTLIKG